MHRPQQRFVPCLQPGLMLCLCVCVCAEILYMFGGWDGTADLCDLWQFSVSSLQWLCLSGDTALEVGLLQQFHAVPSTCLSLYVLGWS